MAYSPISHLIALVLLSWFTWELRRVGPEKELRRTAWVLVTGLLAWLLLSSWIGYRGLYLSKNDPYAVILLGIAAPFLLISGFAASSVRARDLLVRFATRMNLRAATLVHGCRVLGLGAIYKGWMGELPGHFIIPVGIPDFLVGLSSLWVARRLAVDPAAHRGILIGWNAVGAFVLLMAPVLMQLSQPGPLHFVFDGPRTDEVFSFPMVVVPTFVAPMFIIFHLASILHLRRFDRADARDQRRVA